MLKIIILFFVGLFSSLETFSNDDLNGMKVSSDALHWIYLLSVQQRLFTYSHQRDDQLVSLEDSLKKVEEILDLGFCFDENSRRRMVQGSRRYVIFAIQESYKKEIDLVERQRNIVNRHTENETQFYAAVDRLREDNPGLLLY